MCMVIMPMVAMLVLVMRCVVSCVIVRAALMGAPM